MKKALIKFTTTDAEIKVGFIGCIKDENNKEHIVQVIEKKNIGFVVIKQNDSKPYIILDFYAANLKAVKFFAEIEGKDNCIYPYPIPHGNYKLFWKDYKLNEDNYLEGRIFARKTTVQRDDVVRGREGNIGIVKSVKSSNGKLVYTILFEGKENPITLTRNSFALVEKNDVMNMFSIVCPCCGRIGL